MEIKVNKTYFITLPEIVDGYDGTLSVAEQDKNIPFLIKRVFYIYNFGNKDSLRGKHAHRKVEQVIFCIRGSFDIILDDGNNKQTIRLYKPNKGLFLGTYLWNEMSKFSKDCLILVFASDFYDEKEYIRDYQVFKNEIS